MGWSASEEREIYSLEELIEKFSLEGVHRSNAIFNYEPNNPKRWTDDKAHLDERRVHPHDAAGRAAAAGQNGTESGETLA